MRILCGDIGGTKTLIQLIDISADSSQILKQERFVSNDYQQFNQVVKYFLSTVSNQQRIDAACFGVAGPVITNNDSQTASITNLPWKISSSQLATEFSIQQVALINDFQAIGYGISALTENDLVTLQKGKPMEHANQLIVGAGTGLGVAQLIWTGSDYKVAPTEAGHCDFAAATELQLELQHHLLKQEGRCSVEFVVSGPGLVNIFKFLALRSQQLESDSCQAIILSPDPAAAIAEAADSNENSIASQAMDLFIQAYAGQAGNFALSSLALNGVYIAGGIAPKVLHRLQGSAFIDAFNAKGKMSHLMQNIPVKVITNTEVGLIGSRVYAQRLVENNN